MKEIKISNKEFMEISMEILKKHLDKNNKQDLIVGTAMFMEGVSVVKELEAELFDSKEEN